MQFGCCDIPLKDQTSPTDVVNCSNCPRKYHFACLKLTRNQNKTYRLNNKYVCPNCKECTTMTRNDEMPDRAGCSAKQTGLKLNEHIDSASTDFLSSAQSLASMAVPTEVLASFTNALQQMQRVFDSMKREMNDFTTSLNYTSAEVTDFRNEVSEMKSQLKELDFYKSEVKNLRAEVVELRQELEVKEQRQLLQNVEITGLSENNGENLHQIVNTICVKLGVQLEPRDVDDVRRVGQRGGGGTGSTERPRPVVLTLTRRAPRNEILRAARVRRGLTTDKLELPGNPRRIFINEHLTKTNRVLFSKARAAGAELKFKFVWTSNGTIYMRRSETSSVIQIPSEAVLDKIRKETVPGRRSEPFQNTVN